MSDTACLITSDVLMSEIMPVFKMFAIFLISYLGPANLETQVKAVLAAETNLDQRRGLFVEFE